MIKMNLEAIAETMWENELAIAEAYHRVATLEADLADLKRRLTREEARVQADLMISGNWGRNADERKISTVMALEEDEKVQEIWGQIEQKERAFKLAEAELKALVSRAITLRKIGDILIALAAKE